MNLMTEIFEELEGIIRSLEQLGEEGRQEDIQTPMDLLWNAAQQVGNASSGSWIGYHANVYYTDLQPPPLGAHFSSEWGGMGTFVPERTKGEWVEFDPSYIEEAISNLANNPDLYAAEIYGKKAAETFRSYQRNVLSIIEILIDGVESRLLGDLGEELQNLSAPTEAQVLGSLRPLRVHSRDRLAVNQGIWTPPHIPFLCQVQVIRSTIETVGKLAELTRQVKLHGSRLQQRQRQDTNRRTMIFIGHGRSPMWMELKIFLADRLGLPVDEYSRVSSAGRPTTDRLLEMMETAAAAFLLMTGEDETADGSLHARENVIHEVGLFQSRLGLKRAIVLLEDGCTEFSNVVGLGQIRFPKGNISARFEEIRQVLEREGLIGQ